MLQKVIDITYSYVASQQETLSSHTYEHFRLKASRKVGKNCFV